MKDNKMNKNMSAEELLADRILTAVQEHREAHAHDGYSWADLRSVAAAQVQQAAPVGVDVVQLADALNNEICIALGTCDPWDKSLGNKIRPRFEKLLTKTLAAAQPQTREGGDVRAEPDVNAGRWIANVWLGGPEEKLPATISNPPVTLARAFQRLDAHVAAQPAPSVPNGVLREALEGLLTAVKFKTPTVNFGTSDDPNLCWEARVPVAFTEIAEAALASTAPADDKGIK